METALLQFEPGLMIWTVIVFGFTLLALRKIAWKPLLASLDDRENQIHQALTKAEEAGREAETAIAQAHEDSAAALRRSDELVKQARIDGEALRQKMIEEAKAESQKVVEQGMRRIEAEQRLAMQEVRKTAADLAVRAAARLIRSSMSEEQQREIVNDFLSEIPQEQVQ